ncbi:uncharacterized protein VP01_2757g1 [Puccinia sorghi]|uniref:Uncharacterized protein n=1 Tax=Puccinia sorghi TaxID=27349 RepID=A0A0L6V2Z7_9BASI|nr:uncharacterized protein VP01_2757g1 [Puccinia sorghi]
MRGAHGRVMCRSPIPQIARGDSQGVHGTLMACPPSRDESVILHELSTSRLGRRRISVDQKILVRPLRRASREILGKQPGIFTYASVLAENASPPEDQPKPDQNLLEGQPNHSDGEAHEHGRENGDHVDGREEHDHNSGHSKDHNDSSSGRKRETQGNQDKGKKSDQESKKQVHDLKSQTGRAVSLLNVITLSTSALLALKYWNKPHWDKRVLSAAIVAVSAILGGQG